MPDLHFSASMPDLYLRSDVKWYGEHIYHENLLDKNAKRIISLHQYNIDKDIRRIECDIHMTRHNIPNKGKEIVKYIDTGEGNILELVSDAIDKETKRREREVRTLERRSDILKIKAQSLPIKYTAYLEKICQRYIGGHTDHTLENIIYLVKEEQDALIIYAKN